MLDESRDRFRRSYAAGRAAYRRDSLADNYSYPATLVAVLVPAMLVGLLYVWLRDYKMLSLMRSVGICIVASAGLQYFARRIHQRVLRKEGEGAVAAGEE
jgi:hypothetical protein